MVELAPKEMNRIMQNKYAGASMGQVQGQKSSTPSTPQKGTSVQSGGKKK